MYDASSAAPPRQFPIAMALGLALLAALLVLLVFDNVMIVSDDPELPQVGAVLGLAAAVAFAGHFRMKVFDALLCTALACLIGYGLVALSSQLRDDHEIQQGDYTSIARKLRDRPELKPLIAAARADHVVTNAEKTRFEAAIEAFDRAKVLTD